MLVEEKLAGMGIKVRYCRNGCQTVITLRSIEFAQKNGFPPDLCIRCQRDKYLNGKTEQERAAISEAVIRAKESVVPVETRPKNLKDDETTIPKISLLLGCKPEAVRRLIGKGLLPSQTVPNSRQTAVKKTDVMLMIDKMVNPRKNSKFPPGLRNKVTKNLVEICTRYEKGALDF